jgi:plastocyanin
MRVTVASAALVTELAAVCAACGSGSGTKSATPAPAASSTTVARADATPGGPKFTVKAANSMYDNTALVASAGVATIEFDNTDAGVMHNLHLHLASDDSQVVGETPVTEGPNTQVLTVTMAPGDYHFHCLIHPTTMAGTLTVR